MVTLLNALTYDFGAFSPFTINWILFSTLFFDVIFYLCLFYIICSKTLSWNFALKDAVQIKLFIFNVVIFLPVCVMVQCCHGDTCCSWNYHRNALEYFARLRLQLCLWKDFVYVMVSQLWKMAVKKLHRCAGEVKMKAEFRVWARARG